MTIANEKEIQHIKEGNFALPTSQQPSPLFSFGQNILDKGDIQALAQKQTNTNLFVNGWR